MPASPAISSHRVSRRFDVLALAAAAALAGCGGGGGPAGTPVNDDPNGWHAVTALKTEDTAPGSGTPIAAGAPAAVAYTGWLYDVRVADHKGTKVDSNVGGAPLTFTVGNNNLIKGFDQGVVGMKPGGKRTVTIPAALGYGATGQSPAIPPNAALVFDIELDPLGWAGVTALKTVDTAAGNGAAAAAGSTVSVIYTGWLYDARTASTKGTQFDSNVGGRALTVTLGSGSVIPGFDQGLRGMRPGGKRTLTIPASLGYGNAGQGNIPGGAALVFDVEVTAVN